MRVWRGRDADGLGPSLEMFRFKMLEEEVGMLRRTSMSSHVADATYVMGLSYAGGGD